jgi:uncharacterized membrane protein YccC
MKKIWAVIVLATIVALLPFSGFPEDMQQVFYTIFGFVIAVLSLFILKDVQGGK